MRLVIRIVLFVFKSSSISTFLLYCWSLKNKSRAQVGFNIIIVSKKNDPRIEDEELKSCRFEIDCRQPLARPLDPQCIAGSFRRSRYLSWQPDSHEPIDDGPKTVYANARTLKARYVNWLPSATAWSYWYCASSDTLWTCAHGSLLFFPITRPSHVPKQFAAKCPVHGPQPVLLIGAFGT